jgi:hypothetical protein
MAVLLVAFARANHDADSQSHEKPTQKTHLFFSFASKR